MKFKRIISTALLSSMLFIGCGSTDANTNTNTTDARVQNNGKSVTDVLDAQVEQAQGYQVADDGSVTVTTDSGDITLDLSDPTASYKTQAAENIYTYSSDEISLDMASMSGDMVYSTLTQLMYDPSERLGEVVSIAGSYSVFEDNGNVYHAVTSSDITACCSQGIEFIWGDNNYEYPQDYPTIGQPCVVTGILEMYEEDGLYYLRLKNAEVTF